MDKKTLAVAFMIALLAIAFHLGGAQHSFSVTAVEFPDDIVELPVITILSPENKTYSTNNITLTFNVSIGKILDPRIATEVAVSQVWYKGDWQQTTTFLDRELFAGRKTVFSSYVIDVPEGIHSLTICARETTYDPDMPPFFAVEYYSYLSVAFTIDTTPPTLSILSPEAKAYDMPDMALNFTVNAVVAQVAFSLDGQDNVTISGNTTLTGLSTGAHNVTVYAWDEAGNVGTSETISFSVSEPFPAVLVAAASLMVIVIVVGLLVYFMKVRKRSRRQA